jgi:hypothetical protein
VLTASGGTILGLDTGLGEKNSLLTIIAPTVTLNASVVGAGQGGLNSGNFVGVAADSLVITGTGSNANVIASGRDGLGATIRSSITADVNAAVFTSDWASPPPHIGSFLIGSTQGGGTFSSSAQSAASSVNSGTQAESSRKVILRDGALLDFGISLFELVDPRVCLPADQREDADRGCASGGATSQTEAPAFGPVAHEPAGGNSGAGF